jgi:anti-anti-sigma regulatory factor
LEAIDTYTNGQLQLEVTKNDHAITIRFLGKSILRESAEFLMPILLQTLAETTERNKRLVMDFRDLTYMNSSTLTPVIKILERARIGDGKVTALYRAGLKWQSISFSALGIFQTNDRRIEIKGAE